MENKELIKNEDIIKFANKINKNAVLKIIPVKTEQSAIIDNCYENVKNQILVKGGNIIYGWIIHSYFVGENIVRLDAEAHAIWRNKKKEIYCISPQSSKDIIFVEDTSNFIKNNNPVPNYRASLVNNYNLMKIFELSDFIKIEMNKYVNIKFRNFKAGEMITFYNIGTNLVINYNNELITVVEPKIIKMNEILNDINNMNLIFIQNDIENLAKTINYKFKYLIKI